jgi:ABC-type xylose transport system permease subunit
MFNLLGVAADFQGVFKGVIILFAVGVDTYHKKK